MRIAIHKNKSGFTKYWISYCEKKQIPFKLVDAFSTDILKDVKECTHFFWHLSHESYNDQLISKPLIQALESSGIKVFPSSRHLWHFDDKIAQKYFFDIHGFRHAQTDIYYSNREAIRASQSRKYPFVMKLRRGSASSNVFLIQSATQARFKIWKSFYRGYALYNVFSRYSDLLRKESNVLKKLILLLKWPLRYVFPPKYSRLAAKERGYVMMQDFIANQGEDIRVVVAGNRAVALKRSVRPGDFRASGSGHISYPNEQLDKDIVATAFDISDKLEVGSIGVDFIQGKDGINYVIEMSYGFPAENFLEGASGSWNRDGQFIKEPIHLQDWILEEMIGQKA